MSHSAPFARNDAPNAHAETHSPMSNERGGHPTESVTAIHINARPMAMAQVQWNHFQNLGEKRIPCRGSRRPSLLPKRKLISARRTRNTADAPK